MQNYSLTEDDPRIKAKAAELREWITLDVAINVLAAYMVASDIDMAIMDEMDSVASNLTGIAKQVTKEHLGTISFAQAASKLAKVALVRIVKAKTDLSTRGKAAANARHSKPGESREKRDLVRAAWASGKYSSRDICAEQECAALNMAFGTARKALRNTPEPPRRCSA